MFHYIKFNDLALCWKHTIKLNSPFKAQKMVLTKPCHFKIHKNSLLPYRTKNFYKPNPLTPLDPLSPLPKSSVTAAPTDDPRGQTSPPNPKTPPKQINT